MQARTLAVGLLGAAAFLAGTQAQAATYYDNREHAGVVLEADAEYGGDNLVKVFFTNGDTQDIKAGQGLTFAVGGHYRPASVPVDFTATVGYKFVRTAGRNTDLGIDRVVIKFTGSYELPQHFWLDAGPVWHTGVKLRGDGFVPDINFDDAVGVTLGVGWRWIGVSYTNIKYRSPITGSVDGSNAGITFAWKF